MKGDGSTKKHILLGVCPDEDDAAGSVVASGAVPEVATEGTDFRWMCNDGRVEERQWRCF